MTDTRSPDEIERDIERERNELGEAVDELQDRFSPERLLRDLGRGLSDHGGEFGTAVTQSVKRNPVALAITGIGLAWLMSGKSWDETRDGVKDGVRSARDRVAPARPRADRRAGTPDRAPRPLTERFGADHPVEDDWLWAADDDLWEEDDHRDAAAGGAGVGDRLAGAASSAGQGVQAATDSAAQGAASARDGLAAAGRSTADRARRIRARLAHGTESLTEEARERVIAARWSAVKARRAAARRARRGADAVSDFYEENPLVVGGLALAAGAILAGALPRTRQEDRAFGAWSDEAYDRAERVFHAERRKATKVAERAAETAGDVIKEEREKLDDQAPGEKSAVEHVADEVREGASRVAGETTEEARRQDLGKPVK